MVDVALRSRQMRKTAFARPNSQFAARKDGGVGIEAGGVDDELSQLDCVFVFRNTSLAAASSCSCRFRICWRPFPLPLLTKKRAGPAKRSGARLSQGLVLSRSAVTVGSRSFQPSVGTCAVVHKEEIQTPLSSALNATGRGISFFLRPLY